METERGLADLVAQFEVSEDERRSVALATTGFTILSPDQRAIAILHQSTLDEIQNSIELGDFFRARARIRGAMRMYEAGNLFEFDEADYMLLRIELEKIEATIEAARLDSPATGRETELE